ncbi:acyltransferase [Mesorhizobium sp. NPDC059025]|uniref:acyltransferase family protein n=1 Tax=unclassified Mesorhizobium TaxID=325217 RepID=UPI0036BB0587
MSDRVRIARVLCIFFMMFVHVQPGIMQNIQDRDTAVFDFVYFIFTRILGLSSVSLLSVVSGYFIVASLLKTDLLALARSKFRTLIVPMVAWNLVMLALLAAYGFMTDKWQDMPDLTILGWANALFAVTEWPLDVPLWFLRDLFVCCLLSPLVYQGLKRFALPTMTLLAVYTLFGENLYLLQRPQLLLFFSLGMWLRIAGTDTTTIDRLSAYLAIGLTVMIGIFIFIRLENILIGEMNDQLRITLDTLLRITMAGGFWMLTALIRHSGFAATFIRLEPYSFVLFCSHAILFNFAGIVFRRFFGDYGSPLFPITFFTLPLLAVLCAVVGLQMISRSPPLLLLLNAGHGVPPWRKAKEEMQGEQAGDRRDARAL